MSSEVRKAGFERGQVLGAKRILGHSAVHFERADGRDEHRRRRLKAGLAALDVEKFLGAEIRAEASFSDNVIGEFERRSRRHHGIATVGDVGEGAPVHQRGRSFERLHEIGLERLLEERRHGARRFEIQGADRPPVSGPADHHTAELLLELLKAGCEAEGRHDLRGDGNVETVLAWKAVARAEPDNCFAKRAVVHIEHAPPGDAPLIEAERVAPVHVIVDHRRKQIVRRCDGVKIAGEMEVDLVHGNNLGVAAAGRAALHAEARARARVRADRSSSSCRCD